MTYDGLIIFTAVKMKKAVHSNHLKEYVEIAMVGLLV